MGLPWETPGNDACEIMCDSYKTSVTSSALPNVRTVDKPTKGESDSDAVCRWRYIIIIIWLLALFGEMRNSKSQLSLRCLLAFGRDAHSRHVGCCFSDNNIRLVGYPARYQFLRS